MVGEGVAAGSGTMRSRLQIGEEYGKIVEDYEEWEKAVRDYKEFKRIRRELGKPVQGFADKERITRDLLGDGSADGVEAVGKKSGYFEG